MATLEAKLHQHLSGAHLSGFWLNCWKRSYGEETFDVFEPCPNTISVFTQLEREQEPQKDYGTTYRSL